MSKNNIIPYSRQKIFSSDIKIVSKVLKSDFLTTGPMIERFENNLKNYCNAKYAITTNSATSALHLSCLSLGLSKNDIIWTSPISFVASANCGIYCGAKVEFVDIDLDTYNISIEVLKKKLKISKKNKTLPKILVVVHLGGYSCDMYSIYKLSKIYKFKIIEDASHALGGEYKNFKIGSCKYSDMAVFSFHPVKPITTGEGGAVLTNKKKIAISIEKLRNHGINKVKSKFIRKNQGPWYYEQTDLGYNYRLSDISAALGVSQLKRLNKFVKIRNKIFNYYKKSLKNLPIEFQKKQNDIKSSMHLIIIRVPTYIHRELFEYLRKKNIYVNLHYIPIYLQPYYRNNYNNSDYKNSNLYYKTAITLPAYHDLNKLKQDKVIRLIKYFFKKKE